MRFSLSKLFYLVAVIAFSLATFGVWGIAVAGFLAVQTLWIRHPGKRVSLIAGWGFVFVLGSCGIHGHREAWRLVYCAQNLKSIGLALHAYHERYGCLPPQYIADADGRPMHSWRVLILPFLAESDAAEVYQKYRFDEPWDGPHNRRLAAQASKRFRCTTTAAAEPDRPLATHYVAVTGAGTAWPGPTAISWKDVIDGSVNTILVVEIANSDIPWMEPRDLPFQEAFASPGGAAVVPSSHHYAERTYFFLRTYPLAGNVLMADGVAHRLKNRPSAAELAAMLSVHGGEAVDHESVFGWSREASLWACLDLSRCLSFALFLAFLALLVW